MADQISQASAPEVAPIPDTLLSGVDQRGRLFRKYMLLLGILVSSVLLASGLIDLYFTYRENLAALSALQKEKALAAASRIEQYIKGTSKNSPNCDYFESTHK